MMSHKFILEMIDPPLSKLLPIVCNAGKVFFNPHDKTILLEICYMLLLCLITFYHLMKKIKHSP